MRHPLNTLLPCLLASLDYGQWLCCCSFIDDMWGVYPADGTLFWCFINHDSDLSGKYDVGSQSLAII
ncbi:hypothetical protein QUC31_003926, partial [Theobroma cacao]